MTVELGRELTEAEFTHNLERLGITNPFMRTRFYKVFSRTRNARRTAGAVSSEATACGFIEPRDFMAGIALLTAHGRDLHDGGKGRTDKGPTKQRLEPGKLDQSFKMFDVDGKGYLDEDELRDFLRMLFIVAEEAAQWLLHTFESLLGQDDRERSETGLPGLIHQACVRLERHYVDVLVSDILGESAVCPICNTHCELHGAAARPLKSAGKLKTVFITELKQWCANNDERLKDWLDALVDHWLKSMEVTVPEIESRIDVVPDGLLMNLWGVGESPITH